MVYDVKTGQEIVDKIAARLDKRLKRRDRNMILKAYELAEAEHRGQMRDSGDSFIHHPVEVALILADLKADVDTIVAGLLHDVVEDCDVSLDMIRTEFGDNVSSIVDGVTKISNLRLNEKLSSKALKSRMKAETIRKMLLAMARDLRIIIVKLADRLHNMRTIEHLKDVQKRKEKALETLNIYAPIAHRIGIHKMKWELEDISFKTIYPDEYKELKKMLNRKLKERESIMDEYQDVISQELKKYKISFRMKGRIKHLYSIWGKMTKKNKAFNEIYDLIALRIVTDDDVNCYKVLGILHALWPPLPGRFKDYIAAPKSNGYRSLHTTVITHRGEPLEIQIRTEKMNKEAEFGVAAHWLYKEGVDLSSRTWLNQLVNWHREFIESFSDLNSVSTVLEPDEVFVFTPKGEVIHLPKNATPIDFAYAIHTEVGHHFAGAKVNDRIVPIDYKLQLGDRVEIIVNKSSSGPSLDWLKYAHSNSTKAKIRRFFKNKYNTEYVNKGKEVIRKISKKMNKPIEGIIHSEPIEKLMDKYKLKNEYELYLKIGEGEITNEQLMKILMPEEEEEELPEIEESLKETKPGKGKEVIVGGQSGIDVHFAKCCTPLPGDEIAAVISSKGISVHKSNCPNIKSLPADKLVDAYWSPNTNRRYTAKILVDFKDNDKSCIPKIMERIESKHGSINKYAVETGKWGYNSLKVTLLVRDVSHLTSVMENIRGLKNVQVVKRIGRSS